MAAGALALQTNCSDGSAVYSGRIVSAAHGDSCGLSATPDGVMHASLSIRKDEVLFAPETGVVALPGRIDEAGHIVAGKTLAGADHKPFTLAFEGNLLGAKIVGVYGTPRCRATVELSRPG